MTAVPQAFAITAAGAAVAASIFTLLLVLKSVLNYSHTGPQIRDVIRRLYPVYVIYSLCRLSIAAWLIGFVLALPGIAGFLALRLILRAQICATHLAALGLISIVLCIVYQFCHCLLFEPGSIAANSHYRMSRFYPLWRRLRPRLLRAVATLAGAGLLGLAAAATFSEPTAPARAYLWVVWAVTLAILCAPLLRFAIGRPGVSAAFVPAAGKRPNIVFIGCDTLRADRVVPGEYRRELTPNIQKLAAGGQLFTNCYVPIARTAPSLASLLTGVWPHEHGIRDNFVSADALAPDVPRLPRILKRHGYRTIALSDWAGSDLGKFDFGFDEVDLPEDQWNMKYLIRQGPKDLRLFLTLFTHNALGKALLPEIYYVAGRPLCGDLGVEAIARIARCAGSGQPFFLDIFIAAAHPPFSVEYPYYLEYADPDYWGESKFVMSKLTDPLEIIRSQQEPREAFDLDQIVDLYDGCVRRFDAEVGRIVDYLEQHDLLDHTLVVVYSDHGMEFFEHSTWGQGNSVVGDYSARIPLVMRLPGGRGRHDAVVRSIDVAPTVLDYAGIAPPAGMAGVSLRTVIDGRDPSLAAYFETGIWIAPPPGARPDHLSYPDLLTILDIPDPALGALAIKDEYARIVLQARDRLLRRGRWALMYQPTTGGAHYQLFDLERDPQRAQDRSAEHPDILAVLQAELRVYLEADGIASA